MSSVCEVNTFVDLNLCEYNKSLEEKQLSNTGKEIFDSIWGTVSFSPVEELLIDSPLLQRLKRIKQLGYAYQVYCNADYNRFSHTIGATETSKRIAEIIENKIPADRESKFEIISIVRLAAIMHDTGHMFFSHVSEKFLLYNKNFPRNTEVKDALNHFNEKISARAALHEMLGVMIVNSDCFLKFLQIVLFNKYTNEHHQRKIVDYISGLIVGIAVDKKILPYSKTIKGAIDADRMDYLSRDSYITKVPLAVDMARLISKISIIKTQKFTPSSVWNDDVVGPFNEIAIQYSAQRLVWQMSMARTILYQNIYFHHKKLTAEAILDKALEYIISLTDEVFGEHFYKILDLQEQKEKASFLEANALITSLKNRSFYKRVAGFSTENVNTPSITSYELFITHVIENPFSTRFEQFTKDLSDEYRAILTKLKKDLPANNPKFMFIQAGWSAEAEIGLPIDIGDGAYVMSTDLYKETPIIGEENKQKQYYLLTDSEERDIVYLALEKVLFTKRKFTLSNATYSCAKFSVEQLNRRRIPLFERGYYDGTLELLSDTTISNLLDVDLFNTVVNKYRSFVGSNNTCVNQDSLMKFLRQFLRIKCSSEQIKLLLDGVLRLMSSAIFIDRSYFTSNMKSIMDEVANKEYESCYIVKLGGFFDSSNRLSWFFNEIELSEKYQFFENVESALLVPHKNKRCICLFDDGAYSGSQVISIFQELMGKNSDRATNEHHAGELSDDAKKAIKNTKIILSYVCFNSESNSKIISELSSLGIENVEIIYRQDLSNKVFSPEITIFKSDEQRSLVKEKLNEIGFEIINSEKKGHWSDSRIEEASLGYNDAQQMVIFDVNVPTYTISPFWTNGTFSGTEWRGSSVSVFR